VEYDISPISIIEFSNFKALAETPTLIFEISFNIWKFNYSKWRN